MSTPNQPSSASGDATAPTASSSGNTANTVVFTEKEERVLKIAWRCLKTGPPEVDIAKLQELAEFNTQKTASNTWGTIKKKLAAMNPEAADAAPASSSPKKSTPKKRRISAIKADEEDVEE